MTLAGTRTSSPRPGSVNVTYPVRWLRATYMAVILDAVADLSSLVPFIAPGGVVLAAIITGFAAAVLKHRWDVKAEDTRWERERSERRRDELKAAFTRYLTCRSSMDRAVFVAARDRTLANMDAVTIAQADWFHCLAELQTILDDVDFIAMDEELKLFGQWLHEMHTGTVEENKYKPPPNNQSIVHLAQKLIRD
jgi:hypothetical protein